MRAFVIAMRCEADAVEPHLTPCLDIPNLIVNSMHASDVVETWVDGKVVWKKSFKVSQVSGFQGFRGPDKKLFLEAVKRIGL